MDWDLPDVNAEDFDPWGLGSRTDLPGKGDGAEEMGVYDQMMRGPSMGHSMQLELRESVEHYHDDRNQLQQHLSELCFDVRQLYTSPQPPSPAPSVSSLKRWENPDSKFGTAPEKAARKAQEAKLQHSSSGTVNGKKAKEVSGVKDHFPRSRAAAADPDPPGVRNTLLPPIIVQDKSSKPVDKNQGDALGEEAVVQPDQAQPENAPPPPKIGESVEKKALRFGASVEMKTPVARKHLPKEGEPRSKKGTRRKSVLQNKPTSFPKLPRALHSLNPRRPQWDSGVNHLHSLNPRRPQWDSGVNHLHSLNPRRPQWDSGVNHLHRKGQSTLLENSKVREDCQVFSHRSVNLPPVVDSRRMEIRRAPPIPRGLTKAKLQATAHRMQKRAPAVTVMYTGESTPVNDLLRAGGMHVEDHFPQPLDLDDSGTLLTTSDDDDMEVERGGERLDLQRLPVVRLSESKLSGHSLQPSTRLVPRLRLDRAHSPGLQSVTTTGRSGATGLTTASYMSQETLEWKGEYMASGNRMRKDRMLSEIIQIVRQRMRENEEDLKLAGRDPRPSELQTPDEDLDVTFWDRNRQTPSSIGTGTARSTARQAPPRKTSTRPKKQMVSAGAAPPPQQSSGAKLHDYLQKLSQRRKASELRPRRERVRFQLTHMTIREITQSSIGQPSTLHTAAHTPLAA